MSSSRRGLANHHLNSQRIARRGEDTIALPTPTRWPTLASRPLDPRLGYKDR